MVIELVERLDAAASELLAWLRRGEASSQELLGVLSGTKAVRGKLDAVQALAAAGVAGSRGHGDGGAHVLAESTGASRSDARVQVRTAAAVGAMPAVRDAVEEGRISSTNAKRLADALKKTSAREIESDGELLAKAESLAPERFAKEAKRWTAERQADGGEAEHRRLRARRAVRIWDGDDGMVHLYGQFDPVTGRRIRSRLNKEAHRLLDADNKQARGGAGKNSAHRLLDADNKQARGGAGKNSAHRLLDADNKHARGGAGEGRVRAGGGGARSLTQCMADAFENMTGGTAGGGRPYVDIALVARLDSATEKLMASTADGDPLPAGVIERLSGESSWFGLVLSARGVPMWKGRNIRRATESQFQALMALYGGCAGCGEPDEGKVHAHHMDPFAWGGRTDLDNLLPLCWGCHAKVHDHRWQVVGAGDGKHTIRPPDRIHHGPAHMPDTASLFTPAELTHRTEPKPPRSIEAEASHGTGLEPGAGSLFALPEPQAAPRGDGRNVTSGNASRAGPQAARAALRDARATPRDVQAVPG